MKVNGYHHLARLGVYRLPPRANREQVPEMIWEINDRPAAQEPALEAVAPVDPPAGAVAPVDPPAGAVAPVDLPAGAAPGNLGDPVNRRPLHHPGPNNRRRTFTLRVPLPRGIEGIPVLRPAARRRPNQGGQANGEDRAEQQGGTHRLVATLQFQLAGEVLRVHFVRSARRRRPNLAVNANGHDREAQAIPGVPANIEGGRQGVRIRTLFVILPRRPVRLIFVRPTDRDDRIEQAADGDDPVEQAADLDGEPHDGNRFANVRGIFGGSDESEPNSMEGNLGSDQPESSFELHSD